MEGHEMSDEAVAKVAWAFARHGIALHIDRGEMGGGGQVTHLDEIYYSDPADPDDTHGDMDDIYDYKDAYFSNAREGIFHWCLMAHNERGTSNWGQGDVRSDTFAVYTGHSFNVASVFMHELGHNLNVIDWDTPGTDEDSDGTPENYCNDSNCVMKRGDTNNIDYCTHHWSQVNIASSF